MFSITNRLAIDVNVPTDVLWQPVSGLAENAAFRRARFFSKCSQFFINKHEYDTGDSPMK